MRRGHCFHSERFGETGDAFEQEMAIGQESEQKAIHQILLPHDNVTDLLPERLESTGPAPVLPA